MAPSPTRDSTLESISTTPFDLLVIGGGIVGSGVARDAAMRGLRVALIEQNDFSSGTSSRSSRLLHGGLRYLAQGRLGLVHEASVEKKILHRIAPHLARPLAFTFPTYRDHPQWKLWSLKIGVKLYDLLCGGRNLGSSQWLTAEQTTRWLPTLRAENLTGAVRYYDAFTNDARLVIDTLRSALHHRAELLNYTRFISAEYETNGWRAVAHDTLTGKALQIRARAIVNASGPWAEGLGCSAVKLQLTKGVHLVVEHSKVPVPDAVVMTDGVRILFAIPWGERTILGTTDTHYNGAQEAVRVDAQDVEYILKIANEFFPQAALELGDVLGSWAGLRPLIAEPHGAPADISRSHQIYHPKPGWWDVAGGKLTTYRLMAEQTVDAITRELHMQTEACRTALEPLIPSEQTPEFSAVEPPPFSRDLVEHFCRNEWAIHLDDIMIRRTNWQHYYRDFEVKARQTAEWMAHFNHWDPALTASELQRCLT